MSTLEVVMIRLAQPVAHGRPSTSSSVRALALDFLDAALGWADRALDDAIARPDRAGLHLGIARTALEAARSVRRSAAEGEARP